MNRLEKEIRITSLVVIIFLIRFMLYPGSSLETSSDNLETIEVNFLHASNSDFSTYLGGSDYDDATRVTFDDECNTLLIGNT